MPLISESRVLIIAADGFEEWELFGPREILQKRGAEVVLASPKRDPILATIHDDPGKTIRPDLTVDEANADDFDALGQTGAQENLSQQDEKGHRHQYRIDTDPPRDLRDSAM